MLGQCMNMGAHICEGLYGIDNVRGGSSQRRIMPESGAWSWSSILWIIKFENCSAVSRSIAIFRLGLVLALLLLIVFYRSMRYLLQQTPHKFPSILFCITIQTYTTACICIAMSQYVLRHYSMLYNIHYVLEH